MRDFQRSKVYQWEDDVITDRSNPLTPTETIRFSYSLCKVYGMPLLRKVVVQPHKSTVIAKYHDGILILPKWAHNSHIVTHEVSHHFVRCVYGDEVAAHGPEFVGWMIKCLSEYGPFKKKELVISARNRGILVDTEI